MGDEEGEEDELRKRQPDGAVGFVPSFVDVEDVPLDAYVIARRDGDERFEPPMEVLD